jgi:hypothetical protein
MHDINPLGLTMYLRELDRQATPKLRPLRSGGKGPVVVVIIAIVRRFHVLWRAAKGSETIFENSLRKADNSLSAPNVLSE